MSFDVLQVICRGQLTGALQNIWWYTHILTHHSHTQTQPHTHTHSHKLTHPHITHTHKPPHAHSHTHSHTNSHIHTQTIYTHKLTHTLTQSPTPATNYYKGWYVEPWAEGLPLNCPRVREHQVGSTKGTLSDEKVEMLCRERQAEGRWIRKSSEGSPSSQWGWESATGS